MKYKFYSTRINATKYDITFSHLPQLRGSLTNLIWFTGVTRINTNQFKKVYSLDQRANDLWKKKQDVEIKIDELNEQY